MVWKSLSLFSPYTTHEQFLTTSISSLLVLKSCGFIQEHKARIVDVSEGHLRLRLGSPWWKQLLGSFRANPPLDVLLEFQQVTAPPPFAPQIPQANVSVRIRSCSRWLSSQDFQNATHRLMWQLRYHFMACG